MLGFNSYSYTDNTLSLHTLQLILILLELKQRENGDGYIRFWKTKYYIYDSFTIDNLNYKKRFYMIKTEKGMIFISYTSDSNYLILLRTSFIESLKETYRINKMFEDSFQKILFIKKEIFLLGYYPDENPPYYNIFNLTILEFSHENNKLNYLSIFTIQTEYEEGRDIKHSDIIMLGENKAAFVVLKWHGRTINIYILDFIDNFGYMIYNKFILNLYEQKIVNKEQSSLIFKYKDLLGMHFENIEGEYGFILFGYFNSTDPKQILDIKKDGLNYVINLGSYLTLQSNVFGYKKKCIKILEVPNLNESGLFLISNETKSIIKKNDYLNLNTEIKLNFAYNGIIKKGNYLFKFCGVLEEQTIEEISTFSDLFNYTMKELDEKYKEYYNEQRNTNITGRVALVQINALNDIKVFCDDKYSDTSLKSKDGKYITCGDGEFFNVENVNEITQLHLGNKYYYDVNKKIYIKCHERCKKCSKEYNDTNMNCDECYENYFLLNGICLEISKCEYNYYYDFDFDLKCINRDTYCPDFKPYENNATKECIEKCDISELNDKICNPTNNPVSINETYQEIMNNINYLNIEEKLLEKKEKISILGNNVSFIFSTSEIEKMDLYNIYNGSSIILNECEDVLKSKYLISTENPIPFLKIESSNRYSNIIEVWFELFNPKNFSEKLDLSLCSQNSIEIRIPLVVKKYKMDLILRARDFGYNILDLNDSFYNDICSIFTYNNSDFSLSERKTLLDLSDENLTLPGCNYSSFDTKTIRSIYLCKISNDINTNDSLSEIEINDNDEENIFNRLKQQIDFSKASNIKIVKCFFIFYNSKLFTENRGFYIMFFTTIIHILLLMFSFPSKLNKQLKAFCNIILSQMKKIYKKGQNEINLDAKSNENTNGVNNKTIDIDNKNRMNITTSSNSDNSSSSDSQEIGNENIKNGNLYNNKLKKAFTSKIETSNINNKEAKFDTYKNDSNTKLSVDISKIENIKEISSISSQRILKIEKNRINPKRMSAINPKNIYSSIIIKQDKSKFLLNNLDIINDKEIIEELKKKRFIFILCYKIYSF